MVQFYDLDSEDELNNQQHTEDPEGMAFSSRKGSPQYWNSHDPKGTTYI